jgi:hypothetical protein
MTHHDSLRLLDSSRAAPPTRNSVLVINMPLLVPGYLQQQGGGGNRGSYQSAYVAKQEGPTLEVGKGEGGRQGCVGHQHVLCWCRGTCNSKGGGGEDGGVGGRGIVGELRLQSRKGETGKSGLVISMTCCL